jgi:gamma-glutamyltranspeptidase/glutathione hydrolase
VLLAAGAARADRLYRGGAVATQHPYASQAALEMLDKGGNAVDAAVAAAFTLAVVGPYHSGLGGGGFALLYDAKAQRARVLDFRETAPHGASRDMYLKDNAIVPGLSTDGALAVATPGAIAGYLELLRTAGKLKPDVVLAPAIRAARKGFWVTPKYRQLAQVRRDVLRKDPEAARLFLRPNAQGELDVPEVGTMLVQADLARTLETLTKRGASAFYAGPLGKAVAAAVQKGGGVLSAEDIAGFKTRWREPLESAYRGHRVLTMPPPSAGGLAVIQSLKVLELGTPQGFSWRDVPALHRLVEGMRRAYVDRAKYLGDPAFVDIPMAKLVSDDYLRQLAATIDPSRATDSAALLSVGGGADAGTPELDRKHTTHISVVDRDGNAVVMTTTLNGAFGACLVAPGTGILLNNQMDDFAAKPFAPNLYGLVTGEGNTIAPGKIPLSSMSPTLVFQKDNPAKIMLAVGSPGGSTIPTTVLQVISNVVDAHMDIVRAVGTGRVHHQFMPDVLMVDRFGVEPATEQALQALGHHTRRVEGWADAEAVYVDPDNGLRSAASDPRNEGTALGQD